MEPTAEVQQTQPAALPRNRKPSKRDLKLQQWESYRAEIHRAYIEQNHTLEETMDMLKAKYQFTPSVRRFKEKMKEWRFEKYLSAEESRFIATKAQAREGEGKGTTFFKNGMVIDQRRIEKSAKRKREEFEEMEPSAVATPQQITYQTPRPDQNGDSDESEFKRPEIHAQSHELHVSKPLKHHFVITNGDEVERDNLSRTPKHELSLPELSEHSPNTIWDNEQDLSSVQSVTSHTIGESIEISAINELHSNSQPAITAGPGEVRSSPVLEAGELRYEGEVRKYGSRFFVDFGPLQDFQVLNTSQTLDRFATNDLLQELSCAVTRSVNARLNGSSCNNERDLAHKIAERLEERAAAADEVEAEWVCRRAILAFETLGSDGNLPKFELFDAQFNLGSLLFSRQQYNEAKILLVAAVTGYRSLRICHQEISALGSLQRLSIQQNKTERLHEIEIRMQELFEQFQIEWFFKIMDHSRPEGIWLSRVYFLNGEPGMAWELLRFVAPRAEAMNNNKYGIDKLEGYLEYGCMCQRRENWVAASKYLQLARDLLSRASRHDAGAVEFVESRMKETVLHSKGSYESPWDEMRKERLKVVAVAKEARKEARRHVDRDELSETGSGNGSSRYGLTYPGSESTGGGISEFLYP
ncbi:hypothetical protein L207DRAFT_571375 [Hyaloscypha variabilis F]|uniref:Clr5 domain-containing protein n=1 Tax=Hyaloscypha variabilis (strain UAMH 11265 / GT02V1 / F) TaxID=1149755 RepID=A0A2J6R610_HYAVF|nr:hypothetical protein L207DRAFT_571375 [Hyaloscypha variabilis F]